MTTVIQQYNDALPDEQKAQVLTQNTDALNKLAIGNGVNLLGAISTSAEQDINSSSDTVITALSKAFTCSGGLIIIAGVVHFRNATNTTNYFSLWIDGTQKLRIPISTAGYSEMGIPVFYMEKMSKGSHRVEVKAARNAGTIETPCANDSATSLLYVAEIIL